MNEAMRTTASPAAIWAIVIIMPIMTMILITAAAVANSWQARVVLRARGAGQLGPAIADVFTHTGAPGADAAGPDMTGAGRTDTGAPAARESRGAAEGTSREPVPARGPNRR
jgi:hypothetical protein